MKAIKFLVKVIVSLIAISIFALNFLVVLIMWDGKYMVADEIFHLIWGDPEY